MPTTFRSHICAALLSSLGVVGCAVQAPPPPVAAVAPVAPPTPGVPAASRATAAAAPRVRFKDETVIDFDDEGGVASGPELDIVEANPAKARFQPMLSDKFKRAGATSASNDGGVDPAAAATE